MKATVGVNLGCGRFNPPLDSGIDPPLATCHPTYNIRDRQRFFVVKAQALAASPGARSAESWGCVSREAFGAIMRYVYRAVAVIGVAALVFGCLVALQRVLG
jgi:hypothetical protein